MQTYRVLQNLKHSGTQYQLGDIFDGEVGGAFDSLVESGVLEVYDGTDKPAGKEEEKDEVPEEHNTWGPTKDEPTPTIDDDSNEIDKTEKVIDEKIDTDVNTLVKAPEVETGATPTIDDSKL